MTLLELVNKVLRRLREDAVGSIAEGYPRLVLEYLADAHRETQEYRDWSYWDTTIVVQITAGQTEFDLTKLVADGGAVVSGSTIPGPNSFLRMNATGPAAWVYDNTSTDTVGVQPELWDWQSLEDEYRQNTAMTGEPYCIALQRSPNGDGYRMRVYPTPTATRYIRMRFHCPEALIDPDTDADSRAILTPWRPLVLGAVMYALNERGEEMGEPGNLAERKFYASLASEAERDLNLAQQTSLTEFYRD